MKYRNVQGIAFVTALLWLVHPLATQSVTYIVQRMNSMAAMFYVLSLLLYVVGRKIQLAGQSGESIHRALGCFVGSILAGLLALGSKEIAVTLPAFIFYMNGIFSGFELGLVEN